MQKRRRLSSFCCLEIAAAEAAVAAAGRTVRIELCYFEYWCVRGVVSMCYIRWVEEYDRNRRHTTAWKDTLRKR